MLCLIAIALSGCARRSARAVQLPGAPGLTAKSEKPSRTGEAARKMRDAIRSLKDKIGSRDKESGASETGPADPPASPSTAAGAVGTSTPKAGEVGTSGAWSVETRHPAPPGTAAAQSGSQGGSPRQGRLLSRAGQAVRHVGGGSWGGVLALCVIALALVAAALAVRRSRPHA